MKYLKKIKDYINNKKWETPSKKEEIFLLDVLDFCNSSLEKNPSFIQTGIDTYYDKSEISFTKKEINLFNSVIGENININLYSTSVYFLHKKVEKGKYLYIEKLEDEYYRFRIYSVRRDFIIDGWDGLQEFISFIKKYK